MLFDSHAHFFTDDIARYPLNAANKREGEAGLTRRILAEPGTPERIFAEWVQSVEPAGSLIVLRTPPGSAHIVGLALDQAQLAEVAGTICGDDTIFIAVRDAADAHGLADRFRALGG